MRQASVPGLGTPGLAPGPEGPLPQLPSVATQLTPGGPRHCQHRWQPISHPAARPSTPRRAHSRPEALGGRGLRLAWRLNVDQIGTKSKGKYQTKGQSHHPREQTKSAPPRSATQAGGSRSLHTPSLALAVRAEPAERLADPGRSAGVSWAHVCTRVSQGGALRLLLRVPLPRLPARHLLQGAQAERRPKLHVDGGDVEVDEIWKLQREVTEKGLS